MPKRHLEPWSLADQLAAVARVARLSRDADDMLWMSIDACLRWGSPPDAIASAAGLSRSAMYARRAKWLRDQDHDHDEDDERDT